MITPRLTRWCNFHCNSLTFFGVFPLPLFWKSGEFSQAQSLCLSFQISKALVRNLLYLFLRNIHRVLEYLAQILVKQIMKTTGRQIPPYLDHAIALNMTKTKKTSNFPWKSRAILKLKANKNHAKYVGGWV